MEMKRTLDSLTDKVPQYLPQQGIERYYGGYHYV